MAAARGKPPSLPMSPGASGPLSLELVPPICLTAHPHEQLLLTVVDQAHSRVTGTTLRVSGGYAVAAVNRCCSQALQSLQMAFPEVRVLTLALLTAQGCLNQTHAQYPDNTGCLQLGWPGKGLRIQHKPALSST